MAQTVTIPIQNPSFESPMNLQYSVACGLYGNTPVPGWNFPPWANSGTLNSGVISWTCLSIPDGKNVAFVVNETVSQDLGFEPQYGTYTTKFWVANWFYSYSNKYRVGLTIGGEELCATSGWAAGDFTEVPLVCPYVTGRFQKENGGLGGNLGIFFSAGNLPPADPNPIWYLLFDKFSLTFTPTN